MSECGNIFENFIANFYVKFGKLQIMGFHGKTAMQHAHRTVSPAKQRMMSNIRGNNGYSQVKQKSRVLQNHAYGESPDIRETKQDMLRTSSHVETE